MDVQVFTIEIWFRDGDSAWNCDSEYLILRDGKIDTRPSGSEATYFRDRLRSEFPNAVWHDECLSLHRGKLESKGLAGLDAETLKVLRNRFTFKDDDVLSPHAAT